MKVRQATQAEHRGRAPWWLRNPLIIFAIVEFCLLAATVYWILART
jgi:hypothetical protein